MATFLSQQKKGGGMLHIKIITLCIILCITCGCRRNKVPMKDSQDTLVTKSGKYELTVNDKKYLLDVKIINNIVYYNVIDDSGKEIIHSQETPSSLQKWGLFWDENNYLWVESSDIGGFVWKKIKRVNINNILL